MKNRRNITNNAYATVRIQRISPIPHVLVSFEMGFDFLSGIVYQTHPNI